MALSLFGQAVPGNAVPEMFVFDVDFTLWPLWCDTHVSPPFRLCDKSKQVVDSGNRKIQLYPEVPQILLSLANTGIKIGFASRTEEPKWMEKIAKLMHIGDNKTLWDMADYRQIYPGSKISHFKELSKQSGIPCDKMVFFDDEVRNSEVQKLGRYICALPGRDVCQAAARGDQAVQQNQNDFK
eukprot:CAMPEP_0175145426 /NCGR_PEP_ID=MMETSP0087-20121206/14757_1 /TAXON_ID=136419 /ORGANISM="Unknown Unknown, Strain D1" /LENGTH=182 /DNA_ID=CAMNT_0016430157 /DNA_START=79 /DNA_END=627 /DNA_ORIENTATION=+